MVGTLQIDIENGYTNSARETARYKKYAAWCKQYNHHCIVWTEKDVSPYYLISVETKPYWISLDGIRELWKVRYQDKYTFELASPVDIAPDSIRLHYLKKEEASALAPVYSKIVLAHLTSDADINIRYNDRVMGHMHRQLSEVISGTKTVDEAFTIALAM